MFHCLRLIALAIFVLPNLIHAQQKFSPKKEALILFNKYRPVIERKNNAVVQNPIAIAGDINGDGKEDCIISFVMTSKDGGNAIIGHESAIYLNTGTSVKVAGAFPQFNFCYTLDHIKDQVIFGKEYECMPPYNTVLGERKFAYAGGKIRVIL